MVRFEDIHSITLLDGDDFGCSDNNPEKDDGVGKRDDRAVSGKKRLPPDAHPTSSDGNKKRSPGKDSDSEDHHIERQTNMYTDSLGIDSPEITRKAERNTSFESSSDTNNVHEYGDEEGQITTNTEHKNKDQEQEENNCRNGLTQSERDSSDKAELFAEAMETMEAESGSFGNDDDQNNKPWKEFVDTVDVKTIPNLEAYLRARAIRTESSLRFSNAIDDCIQTFRDTTNEILSEVVAPVCNRYTESFDDTEESIIKTMVSNHSRRNKLLQLMDDADAAWSNKYNELTSEILIVNQSGRNREAGGKNSEEAGKEIGGGNGADTSRASVADTKERTIFGHDDSDWEELLEYEPSRERILSFLDERVKRNQAIRIFGEAMDEIHSGLESQVEVILHIASDLYEQHETVCLESEDEIEYFVMENHERRSTLQKELEKSAQQAQGLFANLLSRLSQSVS